MHIPKQLKERVEFGRGMSGKIKELFYLINKNPDFNLKKLHDNLGLENYTNTWRYLKQLEDHELIELYQKQGVKNKKHVRITEFGRGILSHLIYDDVMMGTRLISLTILDDMEDRDPAILTQDSWHAFKKHFASTHSQELGFYLHDMMGKFVKKKYEEFQKKMNTEN